MRLNIKTRKGKFSIDVQMNMRVLELKRQLCSKGIIHDMNCQLLYAGELLFDSNILEDYDIEEGDIIIANNYAVAGGGPEPENSEFSTCINAMDKRGNIGKEYVYKIKGSEEGTVWGNNIFTDDSNIAKAAVLEGKCTLGEEKLVCIEMVEGKSSYSDCSRNGVNSISYGSWPGSYKFRW